MTTTLDDGRQEATTGADLVPLGSLPPLGEVPTQMHAQVVRPDRYGDPATAFQPEVVPTPGSGPTRSSSL